MKKFFLAFLFLLSYNGLSQSVISSAGSSNSAGDYIISWTIGETAIATISSSSTTLTQGFHQPLLVDVLPTGIEKELQLEMRAFQILLLMMNISGEMWVSTMFR